MQKKLIALAVAGLIASPVFAQSSVQIYGALDASYVHWTNDLKGGTMTDPKSNRLGILGEEDLGGGLKAFFQLEERFELDSGTTDGSLRWKDKSWVGLKGGFGEVLFGRAPTVLDTIYGGATIANQDTIADFGSRKAKDAGRVDNGLRFTSPVFGGVKILAHYGVTEKQSGVNAQVPVPFGVGATGTWGALTVEGGWQRDSNYFKTWGIDGTYDFGAAKVGVAYVRSKGFTQDGSGDSDPRYARYAIGVNVPVPTGLVFANVGRGTGRNINGDKLPALSHFGVGYLHSLSKRTQIVAAAAYQRQKHDPTLATGVGVGDPFNGTSTSTAHMTGFSGEDSRVGFQLGLRHAF